MTLIIRIFTCAYLLNISFAQNLVNEPISIDNFFDSLIKKYDMEVNDKLKLSIDQDIYEYFKSVSNSSEVFHSRTKYHDLKIQKKDVGIFNGLEKILNLNIPNAKDVYLFKKYSGYEQWLIISLNSTALNTHIIFENKLVPYGSYTLLNVTKISIVKWFESIFIFTQTLDSMKILHLFQQDRKYEIRDIRTEYIPNIQDLVVWQEDANQLFIGISSTSKVYIYVWNKAGFDLLKSFPFSAHQITSLKLEKSSFLVILRQQNTQILKYLPEKHKFASSQTIKKSFRDTVLIRVKSEQKSERLLAMSNSKSTIVYKLLANEIFVPFQEIGPASSIISIKKNGTVLLLLLRNKLVDVYQYDGWRFVRLAFHLAGVEKFKTVDFKDEEALLIKRVDNSWSLNRINWLEAREPVHFNEETKQWCLDAIKTANRIPKPITETKAPIRISKGSIQKLKINSVNNVSIEKLKDLSDQYSGLISRLAVVNQSLSQTSSLLNYRFTNLQSQTAHVHCLGKCRVKELSTAIQCDDFSTLKRINDEVPPLKFEHVKVAHLNRIPLGCPFASASLKEVNVKGLINGISFDELQKSVLRTSGDQLITGKHTLQYMHAESVNAPNLDVATNYTAQKIQASSIRAEQLNLTGGGLLLPLDGEPVTMTGALTAARAKFDGLVDLRCGLKGTIKRYAPMVYLQNQSVLRGNYTLSNVKIRNLLSASDIVRSQGKSLGEIAGKVIPLTGRVPVRLILSKERTQWTNLTVQNLPKWLTRKNAQMVKVTGTKITLKDVTLPNSIYSTLPTPKIQAHMYSVGAVTSDIKISTISVGQIKVKTVKTDNVYGADKLDSIILDSVTSLNAADLHRKIFTGFIYVKDINISDFGNTPFHSFLKSKFTWHQPHLVKGSLKVKDLKVGSLTSLKGIKIPCPSEIQNMIIEGNLQVKTVNGIYLDNFLKNIIRINDTISMNNITFEGSLEVDEIETYNTNINLQSLESSLYLGNKIIVNDMEIYNDLTIPNILSYPPTNEAVSYVIEGSVRFNIEPEIERVNGKKLQNLISQTWMLNRPTKLSGNFNLKNISLYQSTDLLKLLNTPGFGPWKSLNGHILSKTKLQEIKVPVHFRIVEIPNIITRENPFLQTSDPFLYDLLFMSLKKHGKQTIQDNCRFGKLIIQDNLKLHGKINNLNLSTDVARHDNTINRVSGVKIVSELTVNNLEGLNFSKWSKDVLLKSDVNKVSVMGYKTFKTFNAGNLTVRDSVMGRKLEDCLSKIGNQIITTPKIMKGSLYAPALIVDGWINEVNLTDFAEHVLENRKLIQRVKSKLIFKGDLQIFGNVTIKKKFEGIELTQLKTLNETFTPAIHTLHYLKSFSNGIAVAIKHRPRYWDKFEYVKEDISLSNKSILKNIANSTGIITNETLTINNIPHLIKVASGHKSRMTIYTYNYSTEKFVETASIRAPGVIQASAISLGKVVWIVARLKGHMMIVRYEFWGDLQKYHLPDSRFFALDRVPATNELVLVREDGMWKLEGLAGPLHAFRISLRADNVETFSTHGEFYVKLNCKNNATRVLKARYIGV